MLSQSAGQGTYNVSCLERILTSHSDDLVRATIDGDVFVELGSGLAVLESDSDGGRHVCCVKIDL